MLINETCRFLKDKKRYKISVLEIACGKGGDLLKWKANWIKNYIGLDISSQAV